MTHIIILITLIHYAECLAHRYVMDELSEMQLKAPITGEWYAKFTNEKWHQCFAIMSFLIWLTISVALNDWRPMLYGAVIRLFTHQIVLNYLRGLPITHLGSGFVDSIFKRIGAWPTVIIKTALMIGIYFV